MRKTAISGSTLAKVVGGLGGGAGLGYLHGYHVSPTVLDYKNVEPARRISAGLDTLAGGVLGLAALHPKLRSGALTALKKNPVKSLLGVPTTYGVSQLLPVAHASGQELRDALKEQASAAKTVSIPYNIQKFVSSDTGKGVGAGLGAAGLAALGTGLLRRKNPNETLSGDSRGRMVERDFLRYAVPAMLAGGITGNLISKSKSNS